jgi:uncharacterized repeat protein (TIGR01451 family)
MVRRITCFAFAVWSLACLVVPAQAQVEDAPSPRRASSLSERLERFRRDLLGSDRSEAKDSDLPAPTRKVTRRPRAESAAPQQRTPAAARGESSLAPASVPVPPRNDVVPPSYLKPQAARRAQGAPLRHSPTMADDSGSEVTAAKQASPRRPLIVRPGSPTVPVTVEPEIPADEPGATNSAEESTEESTIDSTERAQQESRGEPHVARSLPRAEPVIDDTSSAETAPEEPTPAEAAPVEEAIETTSETPSETHIEKSPTPARIDVSREAAALRARKSTPAAGVLFSTKSPVLSVEATGPRKVLIGKEANFVVKIQNAGAPANNVNVTVNIPNYVEVISAQATTGAARPPAPGERQEPLEWKIDRLEAGSAETLNLKLVPRKSTPLDLAVHWTFTPESSQTLVEVQEPKLTMAISGPEEVLYGQSKIYKLTVANPGNGDTENVTVGLLPIGRAAESAANHRLGTLKAGESKTIDIELTARQAGAVSIKAQAFADGGLRAEAAEQVLVRRANLRVEIVAPKIKYAGTVGTYRVKVINAGNATGENVNVAAMLPPDAKYVSSNGGGRMDTQLGKVNWTIGTLQPGAERVFEMQCSLATPGENRTQFVAMADGDLSTAATSTTHVEALADLKLELRDPQGPIAVGDDTVYEVHVKNRGTKPAEDIELAVFFSEGLEATTVEGGSHDIAPGQVVFKPLSMLAAGDSAVFRIHARAERAGNLVFRAEMVCQSPQMKLAAEEATHFYGDDKPSATEARRRSEPRSAEPRDAGGSQASRDRYSPAEESTAPESE